MIAFFNKKTILQKYFFLHFSFLDDDEEDAVHMLMDSPQCVIFGMFMIW
jgi:hypothetical protein